MSRLIDSPWMNLMRLMQQPLTLLVDRVFREAFWVWPAVAIALNFALALGLCSIVIQPGDYDQLRPDKNGATVFFFAGTEDGARAVVGMVASAAISVVTLSFSLTVLSLQLAAFNYTPRLIDEFLKDTVQKTTLSVFLGTYAYCFVVMLNIQSDGDGPAAPAKYVPLVAVNALILHVVIMLATFVVFIHHFVSNMRPERVLHLAQASALSVLRRYPQLGEDAATPHSARLNVSAMPDAAFRIYALRSGYVRAWKLAVLEDAARELNVVFRFNVYIGQFVTQGSLLCYVWSEGYGRPQGEEGLSKSKGSGGGGGVGEEERADDPAEWGGDTADERKHGAGSGVPPAAEDDTQDLVNTDEGLDVAPGGDSGRRARASSRGAARASEDEGPARSRGDNEDGGGGAGRSGLGPTAAASGHGRERSSNDADRSGSAAAEHGGDGASCHAGVQGLPARLPGEARIDSALGAARNGEHGDHGDHGGHGIDDDHQHREGDGNAWHTSRHTQQLMRAAQRSVKRYGRKRLTELVHSGLEFSTLRKDDNDASLGVQQLTDVAVRALSTGVNDPQTAVQAMDSLCAVFYEVCRRDLPDEIVVFTKRTLKEGSGRGSADCSAQHGREGVGGAGRGLFRRSGGEDDGGAGGGHFFRSDSGSGGDGDDSGSGSGNDSEKDDDPLVGLPYAMAPGMSFADFLSMCMNPIRAYGASDMGVVRRALEMLEDLAVLSRTEKRQQRVMKHADAWVRVVQAKFREGTMEAELVAELRDKLSRSARSMPAYDADGESISMRSITSEDNDVAAASPSEERGQGGDSRPAHDAGDNPAIESEPSGRNGAPEGQETDA